MKLLLFLLCAAGGPAHADVTAVTDVIVHVAVVDGDAFHASDVAARSRFLRRRHPNVHVAEVTLTARNGDLHDPAWREAARDKIRLGLVDVLADQPRVRGLVFTVHGNGGYTHSDLAFLGRLFDSGPEPKLRRTLERLRGGLTPDARVVVMGCSLLKGGTGQARARVESFMRWLGATEGSFVAFEDALFTNYRLLTDFGVDRRLRIPLATLVGLDYSLATASVVYGTWMIGRHARGFARVRRMTTTGPWNAAREFNLVNGSATDDGRPLRYPRHRTRILTCASALRVTEEE